VRPDRSFREAEGTKELGLEEKSSLGVWGKGRSCLRGGTTQVGEKGRAKPPRWEVIRGGGGSREERRSAWGQGEKAKRARAPIIEAARGRSGVRGDDEQSSTAAKRGKGAHAVLMRESGKDREKKERC